MTNLTFCEQFEDANACDVIIALRQTFAAMSLIGCVFIMASIWLFYRYRNFAQRLILYLSLAAALNTLSYFVGDKDPKKDALCDLQATWMSYFDWAVLLWIVCITYNVYVTLVRRVDSTHYEKYYHMLCWGFPILPAFIPLISGDYGPAGAWCWIKTSSGALRFALWYIPMMLLILGVALTYAGIITTVRKQTRSWQGTYSPEIEEEKAVLRKHIQPLRYYPLIYLFMSIFALANRIQNFANPDHPVFVLYVLHSITSPTQGFANSVVYALSGGFWRTCNRRAMTRAFWRHFRKGGVHEYPIAQDDGMVSLEEQDAAFSSDDDDIQGRARQSRGGRHAVPTSDIQYAADGVWS